MAVKYWVHDDSHLYKLRNQIIEQSNTPTRHYYGTVTLIQAVSDPDAWGLVVYSDDSLEREEEAEVLYRAETRGMGY